MNTHISAALLNRNLTHGAFRIYAALVLALDPKTRISRNALSVEELKLLIPGVNGKPLGETALRSSLQNLQDEGLVEVFGPQWSKVSVHIALPEQADDAEVRRRLQRVRLTHGK